MVYQNQIIHERGREETLQKLNKFIEMGQQINPFKMNVADIHRLSQHPVYKYGVRTVKFNSMIDQ